MKLNQIEQEVLSFIGTEGISPSRIRDHLAQKNIKTSRTSLVRVFNKLVKDGILVAVGEGRGRVYRRSEDINIQKWFAIPFDQRPLVKFDRRRLDEYIPNKTRWLNNEQLDLLSKAQGEKIQVNTYVKNITKKLLVDMSYASSALEGNTYSWADTQNLIENGVVAEQKSDEDTIMIENHKKAIEFIIDFSNEENPYGEKGSIEKRDLRSLHFLLSDGLVQAQGRGAIRNSPVSIGGSCYNPESSPQVLEEYLDIICQKASAIKNPFEKSLFLLVAIPYLQPFIDVNKRTGRLASNIPLLSKGLAPLSFLGVDKKSYTDGLLYFYELGSTEKIAEVFVKTYLSSAHKYTATNMRTPDQIRVLARHRPLFKQVLENIWQENGRESLESNFERSNISSSDKDILWSLVKEYMENTSEEGMRLDKLSEETIKHILSNQNKVPPKKLKP